MDENTNGPLSRTNESAESIMNVQEEIKNLKIRFALNNE